VAAVLVTAALQIAAAGAPVVAPGTVVRWPGDAVTECSAGGQSWFPVAGACVYPIDLLTPAGPLKLTRERRGLPETIEVEVASYPYPEQRLTVPDTTVHLSAGDEARAERERAEVDALWSRRGPARFTLPLHPPLEPMPKAASFGARRVLNGEPRSPHTGVDLRAARGTPVHAAADGTVVLGAELFFSGRSVFLDHGGGLVTMYFHLAKVKVAAGDEVRRGQVIGTVGSTGRATGPHLHFGVRWLGARVEPTELLEPLSALPTIGTGANPTDAAIRR